MATRRPLVIISGASSELPPGDVVVGASAGTLVAGSGLEGGGALTGGTVTVDVALAATPSGLIFVGDALGLDGAAQASGNAALALAETAGLAATDALASGNAALVSSALKLPLSGGVVSGQLAQNIVPLGLYGSGINTSLGNYFTATISGDSTVVFSGSPSNVAYGFAYEVNHELGTITWPTEVVWPAATAPTLTTGKTHIFLFVTDNGGSQWRASSLVDYTT